MAKSPQSKSPGEGEALAVPALSKAGPFRGVADQAIRVLIEQSRTREYQRGQPVFLQGEESDYLCVLISGIVRIFRSSAEGNEKTLALLAGAEVFGEMSAIDGKPRSASAETMTDASILQMPRAAFQKALADPVLACNMLDRLAHMLRDSDEAMDMLAFMGVRGRVASVLLKTVPVSAYSAASDSQARFTFTQRDIAGLASTTRETVSRVLGEFMDMGLIEVSGRAYHIRDLERLREIAATTE